MIDQTDLVLYPENGCGFFSCCTCRLENIVQFINKYSAIPKYVNSKKQFELYKPKNSIEDITYEYFEDDRNINDIEIFYNEHIHFVNDDQYGKYNTLNFNLLNPLIIKYFNPSQKVQKIMDEIKNRYFISTENTCVLFHRGNDKCTEIERNDYEEYYVIAQKIYKENPEIIFLIQSDETEFIDFFCKLFPKNSVVFYDYIRHISYEKTTVDKVFPDIDQKYSKNFLAITIIMSQCKYVICNTGNCSLWIALYRGNADGLYQLKINKYSGWNSGGFNAIKE